MFRDGMFTELAWDEISEKHKQHWDMLEMRYGLTPHRIHTVTSLDDIARECIWLCREYLFTSDHLEEGSYERSELNRTYRIGWKTSDDLLSAKKIESELTLALCDHLIVTFAYRFYCDNLKPIDVDTGLKRIFECTDNATSEGQNSALKGKKENDFLSSKRNTVDLFHSGMEASIEASKSFICSESMTADQFEANLYTAPTWMFSLFMAVGWKKYPFRILKTGSSKNKGDFAFMRDSDPGQPHNLLENMCKFISSNDFAPLLLKKENITDVYTYSIFQPKLVKMSKGDDLGRDSLRKEIEALVQHKPLYTVAVAHTPSTFISTPLSPQQYSSQKGDREVTISSDMQYIFNNYLLEQNLHGCAITTILKCISDDRIEMVFANPRLEAYYGLLDILSLRAPLVHTSLICLAAKTICRNPDFASTSWLKVYIDYWNSVALPILEELFLWTVRESFSFETIFNELEGSIAKEHNGYRRCDRLMLYSLIPDAKRPKHISVYPKEATAIYNRLSVRGLLSGMGVDIPVHNLPQRPIKCIAFDND